MSKIACSCIIFHGCWKPEKTQAPLPRWCSSTSVVLPGVSESLLQQLRFWHKFTWSCCCTALQSALKETNVTKITEGEGDFFYKTSKGIHCTHSNSFINFIAHTPTLTCTTSTSWLWTSVYPSGVPRITGGAQGTLVPESSLGLWGYFWLAMAN